MSFRRRFADLVSRQLDLFAEDNAELLTDLDAAERRYDAADRGEAEELYGDYLEVGATGTDALVELRDTYASTLDEEAAAAYLGAFNRAAAKRFPRLALELDD